ncbi:MAG: hypothetical protein LBS33_08640 [Streptococcaceae bacterium]|jgi:hypothetical protein|nr:hypothetical protein [Streptococcaceae bacterium]
MKKRTKILLGILILTILITGGIAMRLGTPFDHFLTHDYTKVTKEEQIAYLKKHVQEMTEYVKKQNSKIESVQWDWESVRVEEVQPNAGGIPTGEKYMSLNISGKFNKIKNSSIVVEYPFNKNALYPNLSIFNMIDLSVLQNGGWYDYE